MYNRDPKDREGSGRKSLTRIEAKRSKERKERDNQRRKVREEKRHHGV